MRKGLKNQDLLALVNEAALKHRVTVEWVKGHSGIEDNERCDQLANEAMRARTNPNPRYCTDKFEAREPGCKSAGWPAVACAAG